MVREYTPKVRVVRPEHITRSGSTVKPARNFKPDRAKPPGIGEYSANGGCHTAITTPIGTYLRHRLGNQQYRLVRPAAEYIHSIRRITATKDATQMPQLEGLSVFLNNQGAPGTTENGQGGKAVDWRFGRRARNPFSQSSEPDAQMLC
jgi:hypothetical protein